MSEAYCKKIATKRSLPESRKSEKNSDNPENQTYFKKKKKHKKTFSEKKSSCNLEAGRILILLTGRHRGKRVVFIKQLRQSGLLLVTGPYSINGVPLRRVHQKTTITTSSILPLSEAHFKVPPFVDDSFFCAKTKDKKKSVECVLENAEEKEGEAKVNEERKQLQRQVDEATLESIRSIPFMKDYLSQTFSLSKGQMPHKMNF
jgi:large subunit ribosomal protein L6e